MRAARRTEAGFTLTELMISVILAAIATGFAFAVYTRASQASRSQARVAETQQTVRAAMELIVQDLRQAGYLADNVQAVAAGNRLRGFDASNGTGGFGSDVIRLIYADTSVRSRTVEHAFQASSTKMESVEGWADGDLALASYAAGGANHGTSCILYITAVQSGSDHLQHNPGGSNPWNAPTNAQCDELAAAWRAGDVLFTKFVARAYRIKPNDTRGILQASPSGMFQSNDWVDIAVGVIDLQVAVYIFDPTDPVDRDVDGDPLRDWYSGATMDAALDDLDAQPLEVRVTILGKSLAPAGAPSLPSTPSFIEAGFPANQNPWSDRDAVTLPVGSTTSPYYGDNLYRWSSVRVDLRNLGVAVGSP
jgi:prepilin-type N-terminal cleavage/methylation domain-containing protein